ncbi:hypothetical protein MMC16_007806 [Acarospora aff. strigata]|nr:hypothetical protein [Acarospora aff. strigata]
MSRPAPILQVAIQPPKSIMGLKPNAYRMCDMERILSHYQRAFPYKRNKDATLSQLRQLEQELSLTRHDRLRILQPFRDGNRTNIRKHTVRKSSAHRTTVPVAAQGANDGMAVAIKPVATVKVKEEGVGATRLPTVFIDHHDDTSSQKICCICTEELSSNSFPPRSVTDACSHASNACFACVQRSIEVQIQRLFWKSIGCPVCNVPLEYKDVRDFGSRAIFERNKIDTTLSAQPKQCPNCQTSDDVLLGDVTRAKSMSWERPSRF